MTVFENLLSGLNNLQFSNEGDMLLACYFSSFLYDYLKPSDEQINEWRHNPQGKKKFLQHINSKLGCKNILNNDIVEAMFRYYVARTLYTRNSSNYNRIKAPRKCVVCGSPDITVDHKIPIAFGGTNTLDNLHYLCGSCNSKKNSRIAFTLFFNATAIELSNKKKSA